MFAKKSGNVWASGWVSLKISRNTKAEEQNIKKAKIAFRLSALQWGYNKVNSFLIICESIC